METMIMEAPTQDALVAKVVISLIPRADLLVQKTFGYLITIGTT